MFVLNDLLNLVSDCDASDLHLTVGTPPMIRVDGDLLATDLDVLTPMDTRSLVYNMLTADQQRSFERDRELDISYTIHGFGRFRVNVYRQRCSVAAAFRLIPSIIPSIDELGLSPVVKEFAKLTRGLVLVTGPTGSGKSTTLAALVDLINTSRRCHIMTIEDPIEYVHGHKKSMVNQREVHVDTNSFASALKHVLREDPDVILVGEMRDLETMETALTLAETGHLVLGTLHTTDAAQAINRLVDSFPPHQQEQARTQISFVLRAVVAQQLLQSSTGRGRLVAEEILVATPAVQNIIRENRVQQLYTAMQTGQQLGMTTFEQSLASLYERGSITYQDAICATTRPDELSRMLKARS